MVAERWNTDADQAFASLRQYARRRRLPLNRVAPAVVERVTDDDELRREARGRSGGRRTTLSGTSVTSVYDGEPP